MSVAACPFTNCPGAIVLEGRDAATDEPLGVCDSCGETLRFRKGRWMSRDEPYLDP